LGGPLGSHGSHTFQFNESPVKMFSDGAVIQMFLHLASILLLWHVSNSEAVLFEISRRLAISKNLDQFCRALYQLHLVKAEVARHFIPPELKLVQAFGCISCFFNPSFVAISILSFVDPCTTLYLFL
jgi:hypothetical protein